MRELTAVQAIQQTAPGFGVSRSLHVVAELGVADHLSDELVATEQLRSRSAPTRCLFAGIFWQIVK